MQELNLNHTYNPLYWNTACLTVNSGGIEDEDNPDDEDEQKTNRSTNYGKVASAIGNIRQRGVKVTLPDINKAGFSFKPDIENGGIVFGLKGLNGIGDDVVNTIIEHRPFNSFDDFITRMFQTGLIKKGHIIQLIKAGCFDSFADRLETMQAFMKMISEPKEKLTMQNFKMLIENNVIPEEYHLQVRFYRYKDYISKKVVKKIPKPKDRWLLIDDVALPFFNKHFTDNCVVDTENGNLVVSEKLFKKEYDKLMEPVKEWIATDEALGLLNEQLAANEWEKYATGSLSRWEMDSLSYYYHEHELEHMNKDKYGVIDFLQLPEEPIKGKAYQWRGREMFEYKTSRIAGTVLDKDKTKHTVTLLTSDGVVTVKFYGGAFSHYNKQISEQRGDKKVVLEKSWFTRGNKLLLAGFRRGNQFVPKKYKDSIYQHTVALIHDIDDNGDLILQTERYN